MTVTKRICIFPNSNTLSHISRALTVVRWLEAEGMEAHITASSNRIAWARRHHPRCHSVLDLCDPSGIPYPCTAWFNDPDYLEACVASQEKVIAETHPDLVIGIFDFAAHASHGSVPLLTINGACMLPCFEGVLGFDETPSSERDEQRAIFTYFWQFAARAFQLADEARGLELHESALQLLTGDLSLIYEIPEVCGMQDPGPDYRLAGPIFWDGWDEIGDAIPWNREPGTQTVYVNAGTLMKREETMRAMVQECRSRGLRVIVSSGDDGVDASDEGVFCRPFVQPSSALPCADVVVSTGGVGACYTNLLYGVPTLVTPMQPEQATNGLNLARLGCGEVYRSNVAFLGNSRPYYAPFDAARFGALLERILAHPSYRRVARHCSQAIASVDTRDRVVSAVKELL